MPAAPVRKRKKGSEAGLGAASAAAAATSPPPAAKKARVAAPKAKASKADKAQEDAAEPSAREDARGRQVHGCAAGLWYLSFMHSAAPQRNEANPEALHSYV